MVWDHLVSTGMLPKMRWLSGCSQSIFPFHSGEQWRPYRAGAQDEISTGLDSSTTYLITRCIRNFVHMQDATVLMALLQPAPETFDLFDDVMLLSEGLIRESNPSIMLLSKGA